MTLIYHTDEQFFPRNNYHPLVAGLYSQCCNKNYSQLMKWSRKFYSGSTGETELTLHQIPLMHNFSCLSSVQNRTVTTLQSRRKMVFSGTYQRANLGCMWRDTAKHVGLSLGNSELRMIVANPSFASKPRKNYNCGFYALNIIQVDVFWYLMMITCLSSYSAVVSPEPLIIISWRTAAHMWVRSSSSLCFMLGLSGDYWNLMNSFSMKVDFRSLSKKDGGEAKYVKGHTSKLSQGGHKRTLFTLKVAHSSDFYYESPSIFFPQQPWL